MPGEQVTKKEDVQRLLDERTRERSDLDFKAKLPEKADNKDTAKDLAAMTNHGGGTIVYGIRTKGSRADSLNPLVLDGLEERVSNIASSLVDEALVLGDVIGVVTEDDGRGVLVVQVEQSERVPHFVDGQAWGRSGPRNVQLNRAQIGRLFAEGQERFLEEFGAATGRPATVRVRVEVERYTKHDMKGKPKLQTNHRLAVQNVGDQDAFDVQVQLLGEGAPEPHGADEPIPNLPAGEKVTYLLPIVFGIPLIMQARISWRDATGEEHTTEQSVSI